MKLLTVALLFGTLVQTVAAANSAGLSAAEEKQARDWFALSISRISADLKCDATKGNDVCKMGIGNDPAAGPILQWTCVRTVIKGIDDVTLDMCKNPGYCAAADESIGGSKTIFGKSACFAPDAAAVISAAAKVSSCGIKNCVAVAKVEQQCCELKYTGITMAEQYLKCVASTLAGKTVDTTLPSGAWLDAVKLTYTCDAFTVPDAGLKVMIDQAAKDLACGTTACPKVGTVQQACCELKHATVAHAQFFTCADPANKAKTAVAPTTMGTLNKSKFNYLDCSALNLLASAAVSAAAVAYSI